MAASNPQVTKAVAVPPSKATIGSNIMVDSIMGSIPNPEEIVEVTFLTRSPDDELKNPLKIKQQLKSVAQSTQVTFFDNYLKVKVKHAELDHLRTVTSIDGVEVQLDDEPAEIAPKKNFHGARYMPRNYFFVAKKK